MCMPKSDEQKTEISRKEIQTEKFKEQYIADPAGKNALGYWAERNGEII